MILGGLWHGANWTFLLWGAYHGILLAVTRLLGLKQSRSVFARALGIVVTFHLVCLGWVLFRAETIQIAGSILQTMLAFPLGATSLLPYLVFCIVLYAAMAIDEYVAVGERFERFALPARAFFILIALLSLAIFIPAKRTAFIYFQF